MYLKIHNINTTEIFQQFNKYYTINIVPNLRIHARERDVHSWAAEMNRDRYEIRKELFIFISNNKYRNTETQQAEIR